MAEGSNCIEHAARRYSIRSLPDRRDLLEFPAKLINQFSATVSIASFPAVLPNSQLERYTHNTAPADHSDALRQLLRQ